MAFQCNQRLYDPADTPIVVICIDGCADEYLSAAMARGLAPAMTRLSARGYRGIARGALPSFTNPNNASIATGVPPSVHGISGNFFLDPETGQEIMMNGPEFLRAPTVFSRAARAGRRVAVVTAKDKLRTILSHELAVGPGQAIAFSAERADQATDTTAGVGDLRSLVGEPQPEIYSGDASTYVLKAGAALVERGLADFLYLTLTDYIQHKHAPEDPEALGFYAELDLQIDRLDRAGAVIGITADHGMNAKNRQDGDGPNIVYLEQVLQDSFPGSRVILPITDPYVAHHGALGSFACVHVGPGVEASQVGRYIDQIPGITEVYTRGTAARKLELPPDRIGDLVVLSGRDVVIGRSPEHHDLGVRGGSLRSHGGRYEDMVPFIVSYPLTPEFVRRARGDVRNFDIYEFVCNGVIRSSLPTATTADVSGGVH